MNNQDILDNAPEGATHIDGEDDFCKDGYYLGHTSKRWIPSDSVVGSRSLSDIKRIAELEKERDSLLRLISYVRSIVFSKVKCSYVSFKRPLEELLKDQGNG